MRTTETCLLLARGRVRVRRNLGAMLLIACSLSLAGCAHLEAQLQRTATPDHRVQLGWRDRLSVYPRDLGKYTCDGSHVLTCDRAGSITYSCTCAPR
jgi:hypothetical protein